jgi:hypothetical protein
MKMRNRLIVAALALINLVANSNAEPLVGVTGIDQIVSFDSDSPGTLLSVRQITGLQTSETIKGIDFRPATGQLFALGSNSRLYTVNLITGVATQVGSGQFAPLLDGTEFGFDFNPSADRIRVVSDTGQNLRLNPDTGAVIGTDTALAFSAGDVNFGATPRITACAYTNNYATTAPLTATTTLLGVDNNLNQLVLIGGEAGSPSPNTGNLTTRGHIGIDPNQTIGFDISQASGEAFLVMNNNLWLLRLGSPLNLIRLGTIGGTIPLQDVSAPLLDTTIPTLTITTPDTPRITQRTNSLVATGNASDNLQVAFVRYRLIRRGAEGTFVEATKAPSGEFSWTFALNDLARGRTKVEIIATDLHGNESAISSFEVIRRVRRRASRSRKN